MRPLRLTQISLLRTGRTYCDNLTHTAMDKLDRINRQLYLITWMTAANIALLAAVLIMI